MTLPNPGPSQKPLDHQLRELGLQMVLRFASLIRVGRAYQVGNAVFMNQMNTLYEAIHAVLELREEVVLVAIDTDLFLDGYRVPIRAANVRHHRYVLDELKRRGIAGFKIERGVEMVELERFFELFMQPDAHYGASLLEACLVAGLHRMQPVVHASTYAPDDALESLQGSWDDDREAGPEDSTSGQFREAPAGADTEPLPPGAKKGAPRGAARKSYWVAMAGMRSLFAPTALHDELEMKNAKRVVQPLVDGALSDEPVVVGLSSLGHHDDFTYAHSVNVTMVSVTMGHVLGLDRRALADLGVAALLHDVGKNAVADLIKNSVEEFTPEERAAAERHTTEGVKILARTTSLNRTTFRCMRAALEHHMTPTGKGYPRVEGWLPGALSQIVSVADCYVCLQTYRSRHGANVTPYQALGMVLGPLRQHFEPVVLWALVQAVGLYPPGQLVELDDQRIALVLAPNPGDLERPHVRVIGRTDRRRLQPEERGDLKPIPIERTVKRALKAEEYPDHADEPEDGGNGDGGNGAAA